MEKEEKLLVEAAAISSAHRAAAKMMARNHAPDFRLYEFMRLNENGLSSFLRFLLDVNETHGQGTLYLERFVKNFIPKVLPEPGARQLLPSRAETEKTTRQGRRIDIFIRIPGWGMIGIENKPWAGDQEAQLKDYANYLRLEARDKKWCLLYLGNQDPSESSISAEDRVALERNGNYSVIRFARLMEWLDECAKKTRPAAVRLFVEQVSMFIKERVEMDQSGTEGADLARLIASDAGKTEAALAIMNAISEAKALLMEKLKTDLEHVLPESNMKLGEWNTDYSNVCPINFNVDLCLPEARYLKLAFQFEQKNLNSLAIGFFDPENQIASHGKIKDIKALMSSSFGYGRTWEDCWPWYIHADRSSVLEDFLNWENNSKVWQAIHDGSMAEKIAKVANQVRLVLEAELSKNS